MWHSLRKIAGQAVAQRAPPRRWEGITEQETGSLAGNNTSAASVANKKFGLVEGLMMAKCRTCGTELHPERALKYNYCMAPQCQEKNAKGLTMVAIGMNKAADELLILDERTREELASGKYHDPRRGSFGPPAPRVPGAAAPAATAPGATASSGPPASPAEPEQPHQRHRRRQPHPARQRQARASAPARCPWTARQERLALLYNEQGLRPAEIAAKLGVSTYLATQITLAARNRARR